MSNLLKILNKIIPKVILSFIIISLILTGMSNYLINKDYKYVAKVNNQKITSIQLEQAIKDIDNQYKEHSKEKSSKLEISKKYLQQQALSRLINEILLEQYANKLKISIDDNQIRQTIINTPIFHIYNKFNNTKFRNLLAKVGLSPVEYAELIRKKLLIQKTIKKIVNTEFVLPEETERLLKMIFVTRTARFAIFSVANLEKKQIISNNEIQNNYNINKKKYLLPEMFRASYILIDIKKIKEKIKINKKEVQDWYNKNNYQLIIPEKKRYSIIKSETEKYAYKWLKQLQHGIKFSTIAKLYSTDIISSKKGGDIGWISEKEIFNELKHANLTKKGQISNVIKSKNGFFIIKLNDIQPMIIQPINRVYDKIVEKIKEEKAKTRYLLLKKKINIKINDQNTLIEIEKYTNSKLQKTDWFIKNNIPKQLNHEKVKLNLFKKLIINKNKKLKNNLNVITLNNNCTLIVVIDDYQPKRIQPIKEVYEQINKEIKNKKAKKQAFENAKSMLIMLKKNIKNNSFKYTKINFSNPQYFESTNKNSPLAKAVFELPKPKHGKDSYGITVFNKKGDVAIISLEKVTPKILNEQQKKFFTKEIHKVITDITFNTLLTNLYISSKIEINI